MKNEKEGGSHCSFQLGQVRSMAEFSLSVSGNNLAAEQFGQPLSLLFVIGVVHERWNGHHKVQVIWGALFSTDQT